MSRIFNALQHAAHDRSGVDYPDVASAAASVFERSKRAPRPAGPVEASPISQLPDSDSSRDFPAIETATLPTSGVACFTERDSMASERFNLLSIRLRQMRQDRALKMVLITSAVPEEGKSLISCNLAGALAHGKERVLLLEADLRRPTLATRFGIGRREGLSEWLQGFAAAAGNIYLLRPFDFWLMPAGKIAEDPVRLLQSARFAALLAAVTQMFTWIIIDAPPMHPVADAAVLSPHADGVLLIARQGKTERQHLQRSLQSLKNSHLLGVVLNGCKTSKRHDYYGYYLTDNS